MAEVGNGKQKNENDEQSVAANTTSNELLIDFAGEEQVNGTVLVEPSDNKTLKSTSDDAVKSQCQKCDTLSLELAQIKDDKLKLEEQLLSLKTKLDTTTNELEREVQRRCDLEQRFTDEAKKSTEQIEELVAKSDEDDIKLSKLKKKFDLYSRETSSMIESFTTNREVLTSQLMDLRHENDLLLGKFIGKSRDLQNGEINLPQTVEELQFHCLTLNEKFILATLAKEQLEETLIQSQTSNN